MKDLIKRLVGINNIKRIKTIFRGEKEKNLLLNRAAFYESFVKKGGLYFDIGANYGNRIEPIIDQGIKIVAIEPQEECVRYLKKKFKDKIIVHQNGLGKKRETKTLYIANANTLSSFSKEWIDATKQSGRFSKYKWSEKRDIEMITLDDLIEQYGVPDFIKIDVEGFEFEVLQGLNQKVKILSIEYTVPERTEALLNCINYLNEMPQNKGVSFNYCVGENTNLVFKDWISFTDINNLIKSPEFLSTKFGDVYVRFD